MSVHAPEIDRPGLVWFNTGAPLSLARLRGKLVILDFWTFCCINCMHVLPTLRRIEERFPDEVVVIGVHSPKFAAEKDPENVRAAIARYGVVHPVVHDPDFTIWRSYGVRAWPTLVLVGPGGEVLGQLPGEPDPERFAQAIAQILDEARTAGAIAPAPLALAPESAASGRLAFPGKIKPLTAAGQPVRWVIADAGHHQIVIVDDGGAEIARFGAGAPGLKDGGANEALFNAPQGIACAADTIYVADTQNHAIRRIDLARGSVSTLAGTGQRGLALGGAREAHACALASPWDLDLDGARLYFANAGSHQLGVLDLGRATVAALAGSGAESIDDGGARSATLAQPSGLARNGTLLYFADSETSAVRVLDLAQGEVRTLVGTGLFDFGHVNGDFAEARLQHPLGLDLWGAGRLVVADSYNGALRGLDLSHARVSDLDQGLDCTDAVCLPLGEPAGVAVADDNRMLLADTNNHRIVEYRLDQGSYRTWLA